MAARTGASVGVAVTITILGAMSLAFFVTTMVFYGNSQSSKTELAAAIEENKQFVSPAERDHASIRAIRDEASRERKTVVGFLATNKAELIKNITGEPTDSMSELREQVARVEGTEGTSLLGLIDNMSNQIESLNAKLVVAEEGRRAAQEAAQAEAERVATIEGEFDSAAGDMRNEVDAVVASNDQLTTGFNGIEQRLTDQIETLHGDYTKHNEEAQKDIDDLNQENRALKDQIQRLLGEGSVDRIMPLNEEALVDGLINQVNPIDNEVMISIGRQQKAILGMTFAVYDNATDIRVDFNTGEYPEGKAVIEIVRVEETFSRARVLSSSQGNPIVRGDVIANAIYDPAKTYRFVVDGLFDTDGDGEATRYERETLEALIERWGGIVVDDITGDVDFVVLGERAVLPPPPGLGAPIAAMNEYVRLQREGNRYDELLLKAGSTSMPILNANRLQTLIGNFPD